MSRARNRGFTLIEIALVLLIITILVASIIPGLGAAFEESKRKAVKAQLREIQEAMIGYAAVNGRLPCPASGTSDGVEDPVGGGNCAGTIGLVSHGFVPVATLGLLGETNIDGLLLDAWHNPIRYSVAQDAVDPATGPDFTTAGQMRVTGIANLTADIVVCTSATLVSTCPDIGGDGNRLRANQIPALVFSMGRDWSEFSGADQQTNAGDPLTPGGAKSITGTSGTLYPTPGDNVFVSKPFTQVEGDEKFDDIVSWLPGNLLYTRLIQAGVLP